MKDNEKKTEIKIVVSGEEELDELNRKLIEVRDLLKEVNALRKALTSNGSLKINIKM